MAKIDSVFGSEAVRKAWNYIKPWLVFIVVLLVLRYTGALSGISVLTGRALMETGIMDVKAEEPAA